MGGGGAAGLDGATLGSVCAGVLDRMARVLAHAGTGRNASEGIGVRYGTYETPLGH